MIRACEQVMTLSDSRFRECLDFVLRSGVCGLLRDWHPKARYRSPYTLEAVLVAMTTLSWETVPVSMRNTLERIHQFTDAQLAAVGMDSFSEHDRIYNLNRKKQAQLYNSFYKWLSGYLTVIDPTADTPARRVTVAEHRAITPTPEVLAKQDDAFRRARIVANALVAASINNKAPKDYSGDLVVDETVLVVASSGNALGTAPHRQRSAFTMAEWVARDRSGVVEGTTRKAGGVKHLGYGIGVTAIARVGPPGKRRHVLPVVTAIDIDRPTAGSADGLARALDAHAAHGFRPKGPSSVYPYVISDMGYTNRRGLTSEVLLPRRYHPLGRYPAGWHLRSELTTKPAKGLPDLAGPILDHGSVWCPAARSLLDGPLIRKHSDLDRASLFAHDQRLRQLLPLQMGNCGPPYLRNTRAGRPGPDTRRAWTQQLVCPAVQGRVRCPHKPESMGFDPDQTLTIEPDFPADQYRCCVSSTVTCSYSDQQIMRRQAGHLIPGSHEHTFYLEECRSATERLFSDLKRDHIGHLGDVRSMPRRPPWLIIVVALSFAVRNRIAQQDPRLGQPDSTTRHFASIEAKYQVNLTRQPRALT